MSTFHNFCLLRKANVIINRQIMIRRQDYLTIQILNNMKKISYKTIRKILTEKEMKDITGGCCPHGGRCSGSIPGSTNCDNDHDCELVGLGSCNCYGTW